MFQALQALGFVSGVAALAPAGPWDAFNLAPATRVVYPTLVHGVTGNVSAAQNLIGGDNGMATISGNGSFVTLDYGKEVGGWVSINFGSNSPGSVLSLSFTESPVYIRPFASDDSVLGVPNTTYDGVLTVSPAPSDALWTMPLERLRGGFRYLTLVSNSDQPVSISNISLEIGFSTNLEDMRAYTGYFFAKDPSPPTLNSTDADFLTRLWYAGAYTVQTNVVPIKTGRDQPRIPPPGWMNNGSLGVTLPGTDVIIVDGAKRDRAVWPGDMYIALPTQFVSTGDLVPSKNAIATMFNYMNPTTGQLTESGPPLLQTGSDTYHMWTLIGASNVFNWGGDVEWLQTIWSNYTLAVSYVMNKVDSTGLMNVTGLRDWARMGQGGHNAEANAILYELLQRSSAMAAFLNQTTLAAAYNANATALKTVYNEVLWVESVGLYKDNITNTTIYPQDANSMAILFGLADDNAATISDNLVKNWGEFGPIPPELPDTVTPFISGYELQAHFVACKPATAMNLIHTEWGYMMYTNLSVQSTLIEGFTANGSIGYRFNDGYGQDPSYTSHAHGWSTAPTSSLTYFVLGLQFSSPQGKTWSLQPYLSGLPAAQGGFDGVLGWFGVNWSLSGKQLTMAVNTPAGTTGTMNIPTCNGVVKSVTVDGRLSKGVSNIKLAGGKRQVVVHFE